MVNDGSMASQCEDWIVAQIQAVEIEGEPVFENVEVAPFVGTLADNAKDAAEQLLAGKRASTVHVRYRGDSVEPLESGEQRIAAFYDILTAVKNSRDGASRRGDGTMPGTNMFRELFYDALHDERPGISSGSRTTDKTRWMGSDEVWHPKGATIMVSRLRIDEVRSA